MIDEDRTMQLYGYTSDELSSGSHKYVVVVCEDCGRYRIALFRSYNDLCKSCGVSGDRNPFYGEHHTDQTRQKMRDGSPHIHGEDHYLFGKHPSVKTCQKIRESAMQRIGENAGNWKGGQPEVECGYCGIIFERERSCVYPHNFCCIDCWHEYQTSDAGRIMYSAAQQGVSVDDWERFSPRERRNHVKAESLCTQTNTRFDGAECHHLSPSVIIFIPYELHRHISHNLKNGHNMGEINMLAIQYATGWW